MRTLFELPVGESARIRRLNLTGGMRERLHELGFLPGCEVCCLLESPLRDPRAYRVCGTVIALRGRDARQIDVCGADDRQEREGAESP